MIKNLLLCATLLASGTILTACVATPPQPQPRWYKVGVSVDDTEAQHSKCVYDVGMNKISDDRFHSLINHCMQKEGFRWGIPPRTLN